MPWPVRSKEGLLVWLTDTINVYHVRIFNRGNQCAQVPYVLQFSVVQCYTVFVGLCSCLNELNYLYLHVEFS